MRDLFVGKLIQEREGVLMRARMDTSAILREIAASSSRSFQIRGAYGQLSSAQIREAERLTAYLVASMVSGSGQTGEFDLSGGWRGWKNHRGFQLLAEATSRKLQNEGHLNAVSDWISRDVASVIADLVPEIERWRLAYQPVETKHAETLMESAAIEYCDRDPRVFTPPGAVEALYSMLIGHPIHVDVVSNGSLGIIHWLLGRGVSVSSVRGGSRFESALERFIGSQLPTHEPVGEGKVCFINAANWDAPFSSRTKIFSAGVVGDVVKDGYNEVGMIVRTDHIAGRYADKAIEQFMNYGLAAVAILPRGVLGRVHESFTLMVLRPNASPVKTLFVDLQASDHEFASRSPANRFGRLRTARSLRHLSRENLSRILAPVSHATLLEVFQSISSKPGQARLVIVNPPFGELPPSGERTGQALSLSGVVDVQKMQHIPEALAGQGVAFYECSIEGGSLPGEYQSPAAEPRWAVEEAKSRIEGIQLCEGDLLMSVRGSIGRLALIRGGHKAPLIANQNYVRLRVIPGSRWDHYSLFHWLNQPGVRVELEKLSGVFGIPRVPLMALRAMKLPELSDEELQMRGRIAREYLQGLEEHLLGRQRLLDSLSWR